MHNTHTIHNFKGEDNMNRFEFRKDESYAWQSDNIKLELSNLKVETETPVTIIHDANDITDIQYDIKIYQGKKRKLKYKNHVHSNPQILELHNRIMKLLSETDRENYMKISDEPKRYRSSYQTDSVKYDDFYQITKTDTYNEDDSIQYSEYSLYIGISKKSKLENEGIFINSLSPKDLLSLQQCIEEFFRDTIKIKNEKTEQYETGKSYEDLEKKQWFVKEGKLYKYKFVAPKDSCLKDRYIDKTRLEDIRVPGDRIEVMVDHYTTDFVIKEILPNVIVGTTGENYYIKDIATYKAMPHEKKDNYTIQQIAEDMINAMTEEEWTDFENMSEKEFLYKYEDVIINRTNLYRNDTLPYNSFTDIKKNVKIILTEIAKRQ